MRLAHALDAHLRRSWILGAAGVAALLGFGGPAPVGAQTESCSPTFVAPTAYALPSQPAAIIAADLNGDGFPDLIALGADPSSAIIVLLGQADGTFGPPIVTAWDQSGFAVTAGDFDGDGKTDVVVSAQFVPRLSLFRGNGDGTFQAPTDVASDSLGPILQTTDLNNDGSLDLVGVSQSWVVAYLGNGHGSFDGPFRTPVWSIESLALGDVDGDGIPDAVGTRDGDTLVYYSGRGDGTFNPSVDIATVGNVGFRSVHLADLNGDGKLDVIAVGGFAIWAALGHGDGTFDPILQSPAGSAPWQASLADFDGDGIPDAAISGFDPTGAFSGPYLQILLGKGDGTFTSGPTYVGGSNFPLLVADFGNDGRQDLASMNGVDGGVSVSLGNGDGTFQAILFYPGGQLATTALATGDFNEDGTPDLGQLVQFQGSSLIFSLITGPGVTFPVSHEYSFNNLALTTLTAGDFNGDGHTDLVTIDRTDHTVWLLPGHGDGTFGTAIVSPGPPDAPYWIVASGDFNGDGHLDLAIAWAQGQQSVGSVMILLGAGDGTFQAGTILPIFAAPRGLVAADLDADGVLDLAVTAVGSDLSGHLFVFQGHGNGTFTAWAEYPTDPGPAAVVAADLNGDGLPDLAVATFDQIDLFWNFSGGQFGIFPTLELGGFAVVAADFNADGKIDLATPQNLWLGNGDGTFGSPQSYVSGGSSMVVADFDGNGLPDAAVGSGNLFAAGVSFLLSVQRTAHLPASVQVVVGSPAILSAAGVGPGLLTFQWRRNGVPLSDGGPISGSHTATLTINPVAFTDAGSYDVLVSDACTSTASNAAALSVEFADVPLSSPFHDDIIDIATLGITGGCGGSNYCPTSPVRRDQMAAFLLKSQHGSSYVPPDCTGLFGDVPCPGPFTNWIEQLSLEGITSGCGGGNYCPANSVTRAQMAVFLLKTKNGSSYSPPPATGIFADVPVGSFAANFIEALYNQGITGGCSASPLLYCPNNPVLRQQMATLLVKTFGF